MNPPLGYKERLTRRELSDYLDSIQPTHRHLDPSSDEPSTHGWTFHAKATTWVLRRFTLPYFIEWTGGLCDMVCYPEMVPEYAAMLTDPPPVVCDRLPHFHRRKGRAEGDIYIVDGYHRVLAASRRGDTHIWAYVPVGK